MVDAAHVHRCQPETQSEVICLKVCRAGVKTVWATTAVAVVEGLGKFSLVNKKARVRSTASKSAGQVCRQ